MTRNERRLKRRIADVVSPNPEEASKSETKTRNNGGAWAAELQAERDRYKALLNEALLALDDISEKGDGADSKVHARLAAQRIRSELEELRD